MEAPDVDGMAAGGRTGRWTSGVRKLGSVVGEGTVCGLGSALSFGALAISSPLPE